MRNDRRRRLLSDDSEMSDGDSAPLRLAEGGSVQGYSDAARAARERAVSSLVPYGKLSIALALGCCLLAVGACLGVHLTADWLTLKLGENAAAAERLDAPASLGRWLGSTLLGLAGALALFIFSLRRHRRDDYHGRYRVWISLALVCLAVSLVESTGLAALAKGVVRIAAERAELRFDIVWPAAVATLLALVGGRLAIEIRRCTAGLVTMVGAGMCFAFAASVYRAWPVTWDVAATPLWARGSWLLGYVLVLATLLLYARYVQLEVTGLAAAPAKPKRRKKATDEEASVEPAPRKPSLKLRTDLDPVHASPAPAAEAKISPIVGNTREEESNGRASLSRADRRKMKQERRMAS
jgi:hypothetical protein